MATPPTLSPRDAKPQAAAARAQALIDGGLGYLKAHQSEDGSWGGEKAPPAITALALRAFASEPTVGPDAEFVVKGFNRLLSFQVEDGGIYKDLLATYNTSIAVSALAAVKDDRYKPQLDRAVAYLKRLQWTPDTRPEFQGPNEPTPGEQVVKDEKDPFFGGWGYGGRSRGPGRPDLSNAQMAIEALIDAKVDCNDPSIQRAVQFLSRCQNLSATNDQPWAGSDGGFVYGPGGDRRGESFAGEYAAPDGRRMLRSYGSMTYAGLKSMVYAQLGKNDPRVVAAFGWVTKNWSLDENPGMRFNGPDAAQSGLYYYYHTLARALNAYDEPTLTLADGTTVDWRLALIGKLEQLRKADGSWSGEKRWMEDNPVLVTSFVVLALQEVRADLQEHPPAR